MIYEIRFTREAKKDVDKLSPKLKQKLKKIGTGSVEWDATNLSPQRLQGFALKIKYRDTEVEMAEHLDFSFGVSMNEIFSQSATILS